MRQQRVGNLLRTRWALTFLLWLASAAAASAVVVPHPLFTDNMVLQRDMPVAIYGKAAEGEKVTVAIAGQEASAVAKDSRWRVVLKPLKAGGPYALTIKGTNAITLQDVLVGDVWLCTGQSNMASTVESYVTHGGGMFREFKNVPGDYHNAQIRLFRCKAVGFDEPQAEPATDEAFGPDWRECDPDSSRLFSATGYFFGKALQPAVGVPVGLIYATMGGTPAEAWMSPKTLRETPDAKPFLDSYEQAVERLPQATEEYKKRLAAWEAKRKAGARGDRLGRRPEPPMGPNHIKRPSALYHGVICPLEGFAIKGAIWYQGEGNSGRAKQYRTVFPALIRNWREDWKQGDFPFLFVQLAAFRRAEQEPTDPAWAHLREAQLLTWKSVPNTGMAVAIDGGLEDNIHPPYKELVGNRLAAAARAIVYGEDIVYSGPLFQSMRIAGDRVTLTFDHAGSGLEAKAVTLNAYSDHPYHLAASELRGFAVCGEDKVFHWAKGTITGKNTVELRCDAVKRPVAVRHAWANFPLANLYNKEGFAAVPFRTDDFEEGYADKAGGVAIGKPFSSSHPNPNYAKNGTWGGLVDGSLADNGRSDYSTNARMDFPKNVVIDLEQLYSIDAVRVYNSALGGTKTIEVLLSADGKAYAPIGQTEFKNYAATTFEAKPHGPATARYVKIIFHDVHEISFQKKPNGFCFLREVEVLGQPE